VLLREAVRDARDFIQASRVLHGKPIERLSSDVMKGACGEGRDVSVAALASMASKSVKPISIHRFQARNVFGEVFPNHDFSTVTFSNGSQYVVDPTAGQFRRSALSSQVQDGEFASQLIRDGFIPLDETTASLYVGYLRRAGAADTPPLSASEASSLATRLRTGQLADRVEPVGAGEPGAVYALPEPSEGGSELDIQDRAALLRLAERTRAVLRVQGDQEDLVNSMSWLINRLESGTEGGTGGKVEVIYHGPNRKLEEIPPRVGP
jgi:hypothetical protein